MESGTTGISPDMFNSSHTTEILSAGRSREMQTCASNENQPRALGCAVNKNTYIFTPKLYPTRKKYATSNFYFPLKAVENSRNLMFLEFIKFYNYTQPLKASRVYTLKIRVANLSRWRLSMRSPKRQKATLAINHSRDTAKVVCLSPAFCHLGRS
jgi:hypothetical protein